jgi:hypothetical protein
MDTSKPVGEACTPNGRLKEAHEMEWVNDPDDDCAITNSKSVVNQRSLFISPKLGRSLLPQRSSTQSSLSAFGIIM